MSGFRVDLDELAAVVGRLDGLVRASEAAVAEADARAQALGRTWQGEAADAQRAVRATWSVSASELVAGMSAMRAAAAQAHSAYSAAVDANLRMFGGR